MQQLLNFARRSIWRRALVPFGFALGAFFFFLAIRGIAWQEVGAQMAGISPVAVLLALGLVLISAGLRSLRWRFVFVTEQVTFRRLFLVENASLGLNNISPVRLLDEPSILTMLTLRDRIPAGAVVASLVMTRVQDLGVTLALAAIALVLEPTLQSIIVAAVVPSILIVVALLGLINLRRLTARFSMLRRIPGIARYEEAVSALVRRKLRLSGTVALTAAYWLMVGPAAYVLARGMGVEVSLLQATIIALASIAFATATPGLPGAFGTFELAVVELSSVWGVPHSLAVGYGLILHLVLFAPPVIIALLVLPREGMSLWRKPAGQARPPTDPGME